MEQKASQTCDSYMSWLWLALPECKYKHDSDELLKDQFIFGTENKEIQDNLLGEISETDNSVRSLYEAWKFESKLAQRKLLGIVTQSVLDIDAVKRGKNSHFSSDCKFCGKSHDRGECPAYGKTCNGCGGKNHLEAKCTRKPQKKGKSHKSYKSWKCDKCGHFKKVDSVECDHDSNDMDDLVDQVQSLFYHWGRTLNLLLEKSQKYFSWG